MKNFLIALKKWWPLVFLTAVFSAFIYFHLYRFLDFELLKTYQVDAQKWTHEHAQAAVMIYIFLFVTLVACAIPCATLFTLIGGFLFGKIALFYALFSTTAGGTLLFLAVRTSIGARIAAKSSGRLKQMEHGFQQNAFNYLLMLRLVPIFPCWLSNISAGALNVPLKTFVAATLIGIFPATLIYILAGSGLDTLFTASHPDYLRLLLTPSLFFPLLGLAFLSLFPVFYNSIKNRREQHTN